MSKNLLCKATIALSLMGLTAPLTLQKPALASGNLFSSHENLITLQPEPLLANRSRNRSQTTAITVEFREKVDFALENDYSLPVTLYLIRSTVDGNGNFIPADSSIDAELIPSGNGVQIVAYSITTPRGEYIEIDASSRVIPAQIVHQRDHNQVRRDYENLYSERGYFLECGIRQVVEGNCRNNGRIGNDLGVFVGSIIGESTPQTVRKVIIPAGRVLSLRTLFF